MQEEIHNKEYLNKQLEKSKTATDIFLNLPQRVQELLMILLQKNLNAYDCMHIYNDQCTSPIELIFITAFEIYCSDKRYIMLSPQHQIAIEFKKFYADFLFDSTDGLVRFLINEENEDIFKNKKYKLVIECDGHEFHEKSKEQVKNDNERQYLLKMAGYDILRFSGSEIYNKPFECAEKTYNYIMKKIQEE